MNIIVTDETRHLGRIRDIRFHTVYETYEELIEHYSILERDYKVWAKNLKERFNKPNFKKDTYGAFETDLGQFFFISKENPIEKVHIAKVIDYKNEFTEIYNKMRKEFNNDDEAILYFKPLKQKS